MISFKTHDVVLMPFPFTDMVTKKRRPALVLGSATQKSAGQLIVCAMITSQIDGERLMGDVVLKEWQTAHLLHPSKVRLAKIVTVETGMILENLGRLAKPDQLGVGEAFRELFHKILIE